MFPVATLSNAPHRLAGDAEKFSDFAICYFSQVADFPNHSNFVSREPGIRMGLAALLSFFLVSIAIVVSHCTDKQMLGSNARRIITGVENPKSLRYRTHEGLVGNPMRQPLADSSVSVFVALPWPLEASIWGVVKIRTQDSAAIRAVLLLRPAPPKPTPAETARRRVFVVPHGGSV